MSAETSRKKALEIMQKGVVSYQLINDGWEVSDHWGDGYDLIAVKNNHHIEIELKAIDLKSIMKGRNAAQHLSVNEIASSTHLIITVFNRLKMEANYIMSIRQFVEKSGVKKYHCHDCYDSFLLEYKKLAKEQSSRKKNSKKKRERLDFDFSFNPLKPEKWVLAIFKNQWRNLEN